MILNKGGVIVFGLLLLAGLTPFLTLAQNTDTEALLFRSYGDNPTGAVARIQEPVAKPAPSVPTPSRKPVREKLESAESSIPVPEKKPQALLDWIEQKRKAEAVEAAILEQDQERQAAQEEAKSVTAEQVIESLLQETPVSIAKPARKPVIETVQEVPQATNELVAEPEVASEEPPQNEEDIQVAESGQVSTTPLPAPKPAVRETREREDRVVQRFQFNGDQGRDTRQEPPRASNRSSILRDPGRLKRDNLVIKTRNGIEWLFNVELAMSEAEQQYGLMNRTSLAEESGMLFIYRRPQQVSMWMKDTKIPLDMIFIAPGGRIIKIHESARPGDLRRIPSGRPVRGVLEINGGMARELGISEGDQVLHSALRS